MKLLLTLVLAGFSLGADILWVERLAFWNRKELDESASRLRQLDTALAELPSASAVRSGNRIGFQTGRDAADADMWLELELPLPATADSVALVPAIVKNASGNLPGYGFPIRFEITSWDSTGRQQLLVDQTKTNFPNPGIYPALFRFAPAEIKRLRLKAVSPWHPEGLSVLALSELFLLSGNRNVALAGSVSAGSSREARPTWSKNNLIDMNTPLGLPLAPSLGSKPAGYQSMPSLDRHTQKSLTVELPEDAVLDELRLVPVRRPEMPAWLAYGFPVTFYIETARKPDFSDATLVFDHRSSNMPSPGQNMVCIPVSKVRARYVRLTVTELWERAGDYVLALAELQAYAEGKNVALGAKVSASDSFTSSAWSPAALTDGVTADGKFLELPDWLEQLQRRQTMEAERKALSARRQEILESSERVLVGGSVSLAGGTVLLAIGAVWRNNRERRREREHMRERLARDLHDELGSNLGSIALISSFAMQADATPESMRADLAEIEQVARESVDSMHELVALMGSGRSGTTKDWQWTLKKMAERLLRGVQLECSISKLPWTPDPETRRNLYLFCKEALHNAARHAHPTKVSLAISATNSGLRIDIEDNGQGFNLEESRDGFGLANLQTRAQAMPGQLELQSAPGKGTRVHLELERTRYWSAG